MFINKRIEKEKERKERKERIKREREEKERINMKGFFKRFAKLWKEETLGDKIAITLGMILFIVGPIMMISKIASYFDSFEQFMDAAVALFILIVIAILGIILSSPSVTYTEPLLSSWGPTCTYSLSLPTYKGTHREFP